MEPAQKIMELLQKTRENIKFMELLSQEMGVDIKEDKLYRALLVRKATLDEALNEIQKRR